MALILFLVVCVVVTIAVQRMTRRQRVRGGHDVSLGGGHYGGGWDSGGGDGGSCDGGGGGCDGGGGGGDGGGC